MGLPHLCRCPQLANSNIPDEELGANDYLQWFIDAQYYMYENCSCDQVRRVVQEVRVGQHPRCYMYDSCFCDQIGLGKAKKPD